MAEAYARLLATDGVTRGLIGPREAPRLWDRHLLNCAVLTELLDEGVTVADIGSGAGLPGLVLAIRRPDLRITLVEPLLRRCAFLTEAVEALGLEHVRVVRARAEELHGREDFTVVTSRAVAPLPRLLAWSVPLVRPGGLVLAMKGASAAEEVAAAAPDLHAWHLEQVEVRQLGQELIIPPATVIRAEVSPASRLRWERDRAPGGPPTTSRARRSSTSEKKKKRT